MSALDTATPPGHRTTVGSVLRTGWTPAALVALLAAVLLREVADVGLRDQVRFGVYLVGWVTLPGTVVWRLVDRRGARPLVEDLALGTLVGYVIEFPVYLGLLGLGHPRWYLLWPVVVLGLAACTPVGRAALWRRGPRMSTGWSWSVAALFGYVLLWFTHRVWGPSPASGPTLRRPYVDEPYHLSLVSSLKHFSPPKVLYVQDTPLDYHYLSHAHMAGASWVSGIEPIVLLRALAMPTAAAAALLAVTVAASRLSGRTWIGPVALAGILVVPANFSGGSDRGSNGFLDLHLQISPSAGFSNLGMLLGVVLVIELLRKDIGGIPAWGLTLLTMVAMTGAKATSLPALVAGLLLATVVVSVADRSVAWRPLALTALGGAGFLLARALFFGKNAQGLEIDPLGIYGLSARVYPNLAGSDGEIGTLTAMVIAVSVLASLSLGALLLANLLRGGWKEPTSLFLVGLCGSGYGMALTLHQVGYSEGYFIIAVQLFLILGAALGLARHADHLAELGGVRFAAIAVGAGLVAGRLYTLLTHRVPGDVDGSPVWLAFRIYAIPMLTVLLGAAAVTAGVIAWSRRRGDEQARSTPVTPTSWAVVGALVIAGIGIAPTTHAVARMISEPTLEARRSPSFIGDGGIRAARFLRENSDLDAVVATNAHCEFPPKRRPTCGPRHFWMAGYSERQFLVEGWAYVSRASVGLDAPAGENITTGPFWDPERLAENDRAFVTPSEENLDVLREKYDVSWLLVDRAYPVDAETLAGLTEPVFRSGRYTVYELG